MLRLNTHLANKMKIHGENIPQMVIIEKILRSMTSRFDYVMCSVEKSNNLDTLTIDELHEQFVESIIPREGLLCKQQYLQTRCLYCLQKFYRKLSLVSKQLLKTTLTFGTACMGS